MNGLTNSSTSIFLPPEIVDDSINNEDKTVTNESLIFQINLIVESYK